MIQPQVKAVDFAAEAGNLADAPKEEYIKLNTEDPDFGSEADEGAPTEEEFREQQAHEAAGAGLRNKYEASGKLAFQITDTLVPRVAGMVMKVSHKSLQAERDDHEDIVKAYEAVFEYYDYDFDNPMLSLILVLFFAYGLKLIDVGSKKAKETKQHATKAESTADQRTEQAEPAAERHEHFAAHDMEISRPPRICMAPGCGEALKPHQKKYCSTDCRMQVLNANRKNEKDDE